MAVLLLLRLWFGAWLAVVTHAMNGQAKSCNKLVLSISSSPPPLMGEECLGRCDGECDGSRDACWACCNKDVDAVVGAVEELLRGDDNDDDNVLLLLMLTLLLLYG